jgi:hypothetical protein
MTRIRYDSPGLLKLSETLTLGIGSEADVDDELAQLLLASPDIYGIVAVLDETAPTWPTTHDALDALAAKLAVTFPPPAAGKQRLSVGEKVAALEAAGHTPADINPKESE